MAYNRVQVRAFLSASEISLFEESLDASCRTLGSADLHRRLKRTRTLRDKARDLLQRQKLSTRARTGSKSGTSGQANERTARKLSALEQTLTRFEAEVARRESASSKPSRAARKATPQPASKPAPTARRAPAKRAATTAVAAKKTTRKRPAAVVLRAALDKKQAGDDGAAAGPNVARSAKAPARSGEPSGEQNASGGVQPTSPSTRARAVALRLADANLSRTLGYTSTQVRRGQAKRDHKG
ncbi:MAG: hypothetical protein ABI696_15985 [Rubrivivax sp.]